MCTGSPGLRSLGLFITTLFIATSAYALSGESAKSMAIGETEERMAAVGKAVVDADAATVAFIQALSDDAVKIAGGQVFVVRDGAGTDPVTGKAVKTEIKG